MRSRLVMVAMWMTVGSAMVAGSSSDLPRTEPEAVGMSSQRLARLTTAMQGYVDRGQVSGLVTLVARRGKIVHYEALGYRDVEGRARMPTDAIFRIASMTKPIVSVAALMLHEEGHFLLADPISKWLPEFSEMKVAVPSSNSGARRPYRTLAADKPITVKQILTHTAGLANSYRGLTQNEYAAIAPKEKADETVADFVKRLARLPLNFQPGDSWEYSRATCVVGRLVEVISGQTLDEFLRQRIFSPLGMTDTHFYLPKENLDRFTAQYRPGDVGTIVLADSPTVESRFVKPPHVYFMGSGGLVSTAVDYFRFLQMLLDGGALGETRLLGRKTVELMTENHTGELPIWLRGPGFGFGLGFAVLDDRGMAGRMYSEGTYGWGGAYGTIFWVDPKEELIGVLMTQLRPYSHLNIRQDFEVLANQAIVD